MPRLNRKPLRVLQRNFQSVEAAIQLQILWRKSEHVGNRRRRNGLSDTVVQIVAVVKEISASSIRQITKERAEDLLLKRNLVSSKLSAPGLKPMWSPKSVV